MRRVRGVVGLAVLAMGVASCESATKPPPPVGFVSLNISAQTLASGDSLQLVLEVEDANGNALTGRTVQWRSFDTTRVTVTPSGRVRARFNRGLTNVSARVRATVEGFSDEAEITVAPATVATITLTGPATPLDEGETASLTVELRDSEGVILTGRQPTFTSRDESLVRVSTAGVLTPVPYLSATNRSTYVVVSSGTARDSVPVTVTASTLASLEIVPAQPYLRAGFRKQLRVVGVTAGGAEVEGLPATFTSSNAGVAAMTAEGMVTTTADVFGSSQIVANYAGYADTVSLTVDACGAGPAGTYPLEIRNVGPALTPGVQAAFDCAVARILSVIRAPISTVVFETATPTGPDCFNETISQGTTTSGVIIFIKIAPIDGAGAVLGRAGPCFVRGTSRLAVIGLMEFDDADIANLEANGTLLPTILHEMLHVIGIGTAWREAALGALYTGNTEDPAFLGANAIRACREEHGGTNVCVNRVPVEDCVGLDRPCGAGTEFGHWRELTFVTELMTGYLTPPFPPFSRMTIAALADLGYPVDLEQAEAYTVPGASLRSFILDGSKLNLGIRLPAPVRPTHTVDANGRTRPILY